MSKYPASQGVVLYKESNDRVAHAAVLATPVDPDPAVNHEPKAFNTNIDGIFTIDETDLPWSIEILHNTATPTVFKWEPDGKRRVFEVAREPLDEKPGKRFFKILIAALLLLIPGYLLLHYKIDVAGGPLSNLIVEKTTEAKHLFGDIQKKESTLISKIGEAVNDTVIPDTIGKKITLLISHGHVDSAISILKELPKPTTLVLKARLDTLKTVAGQLKGLRDKQEGLLTDIDTSIANLLRKNYDLMPSDKNEMLAMTPRIMRGLKDNKLSEAEKNTADLVDRVTTPPWPGFVPWREEPWRYFEILLWALAGVLVHKIISTGVYLWKNTFQNRGIWMHVAHIFAVPLLVLVTMMLLSMVSFSFSGDTGGSVVIDIGDPSITRAFSFILAVAPWGVWDFVRKQSAKITSRSESV